MFPSKSVQFSRFPFGCVIYLEAIFLRGVTYGSKFNFAHEYLTVPALFVEKTNLSTLNCLFTIEKKLTVHIMCGSISGSFNLFHRLFCLCLHQYHAILITIHL